MTSSTWQKIRQISGGVSLGLLSFLLALLVAYPLTAQEYSSFDSATDASGLPAHQQWQVIASVNMFVQLCHHPEKTIAEAGYSSRIDNHSVMMVKGGNESPVCCFRSNNIDRSSARSRHYLISPPVLITSAQTAFQLLNDAKNSLFFSGTKKTPRLISQHLGLGGARAQFLATVRILT